MHQQKAPVNFREAMILVERGKGQGVGILSEQVPHQPGECYEYYYGGGGGWGDPLKRPPEQVLEDVLDEYVSRQAARREYGVVLRGSLENLTLKIDHEKTDALRASMQASPTRSS